MDPIRGFKISSMIEKLDDITTILEAPGYSLTLLRKMKILNVVKLLMGEFNIWSDWKVHEWMQRTSVGCLDSIHPLTNTQASAIRKDFPHVWEISVAFFEINDNFMRLTATNVEAIFAVGNDMSGDYDILVEAVNALDVTL